MRAPHPFPSILQEPGIVHPVREQWDLNEEIKEDGLNTNIRCSLYQHRGSDRGSGETVYISDGDLDDELLVSHAINVSSYDIPNSDLAIGLPLDDPGNPTIPTNEKSRRCGFRCSCSSY